MAITNKGHYRGGDYNNQEIKDLKSLELNQDALNPNEAPRLSQVVSIAEQKAQDILVELTANADSNTAFTSLSVKGFLEGKQDNMEIDSSSSSYMQIIDGYKIKVKQLLITSTTVDEVSTTLQQYLDNNSPNHQEGDVVFLNAAVDNQKRSWIKTGSASQGVDGYVRLQTDYNVTSIRAMFDSGSYMVYNSASGQFSVNLGNGVGQLGAHTLPVNDFIFQQASGNDTLALLKSLEDLILNGQTQASQATTTVDTRISSCTGVSGSNLGDFGGRFSDESTIKDVLLETETDLTSSESDRAAIRTEFASADNTLQSNIDSESQSRVSADSTLQNNINSEANTRASQDISLSNQISTEVTRATSAENVLDGRLDIIEGGSTVSGSINKAQADAQSFASSIVSNEASLRISADNNLQIQIDAISSAFLYKGFIDSDGRITHIDVLHPNHNVLFQNATIYNGDFYKVNADVTITFSDSSQLSVNSGDGILGIKDVLAGNAKSSDFHKTDNTESADILREGMLDNTTIEKSGGVVKIIDNSVGRTQLSSSVETDIDNKVLKSGDDMTGSLKIDKNVLANTGYVGGYDYALYVKQNSLGSETLTDTQRALLVENLVYTDGSGNPLDLDYANATTSASHYKGDSSNLSVGITGTNSESNVENPLASIYATGSYNSATSEQLGVNAGATFVAQNAATSNLGFFSFTDTAGAQNNRGGYVALAPDNVSLDDYRLARVLSPLPIQDAALVVDDYTGVKHAAYFNGKVQINGDVIIPNASSDNHAVNLGDVKGKEKEYIVNVPAGGSVSINHQLNTKKITFNLWLDDEAVTDGFKVVRESVDSLKIYNNTSNAVQDLHVLVHVFSL